MRLVSFEIWLSHSGSYWLEISMGRQEICGLQRRVAVLKVGTSRAAAEALLRAMKGNF